MRKARQGEILPGLFLFARETQDAWHCEMTRWLYTGHRRIHHQMSHRRPLSLPRAWTALVRKAGWMTFP